MVLNSILFKINSKSFNINLKEMIHLQCYSDINLKNNNMKKTVSLLLIASAFCVTACGPSEEEKAKLEAAKQATLDSIRDAASQATPEMTDSTATADTTAAATEEAHH